MARNAVAIDQFAGRRRGRYRWTSGRGTRGGAPGLGGGQGGGGSGAVTASAAFRMGWRRNRSS
jgi:hypothetical protein